MTEREIIEEVVDENGEQLHVCDVVLYENETYMILKQKDAPVYIMHPVGGNPHAEDIDVTIVGNRTKRVDM